MKTTKLISLAFLLSFLYACAPSTEEAMKYNDKITSEQTLINKKIEELNDTYDNYIVEEMNSAHKVALEQVEKSTKTIKRLKAFDEDTDFKNAALKLFGVYKSVLENEHKRIIELLILPDDRYGKEEVKEFETIRNNSIEKIDKEVDKLVEAQEAFAKKYKFEIAAE